MSANLGFENTDTILVEDRVFAPSSNVVNNANITAYMKSKGFDTYEDFYQWSLAHPYEYWDDLAKELHWLPLIPEIVAAVLAHVSHPLQRIV